MHQFIPFLLLSLLHHTVSDHVVKEVQQEVKHSTITDAVTGQRSVHLVNKTIVTEHVVVNDPTQIGPIRPILPDSPYPVANPAVVYHRQDGYETEVFNERENRRVRDRRPAGRVAGRTVTEMETAVRTQSGRRVPYAEERGVPERMRPYPEVPQIPIVRVLNLNKEPKRKIYVDPDTRLNPGSQVFSEHEDGQSQSSLEHGGLRKNDPNIPDPDYENESLPWMTEPTIRYDSEGKILVKSDPRFKSRQPEIRGDFDPGDDVIMVDHNKSQPRKVVVQPFGQRTKIQ